MFCRSCPETKSTACFRMGCWIPIQATPYWTAGQTLTDLMAATDELGGLQFLEVRSTLPDELLMYADKLSMAHGLELRVPFVDKEIVEYVERSPSDFKVRNGSQKWLHREVCRTYLPDSILKRPKRGFAVNVVDDWFRGAIDSRMTETLLDSGSSIYQYLRPTAVREVFEQHASGRQDNHKILFSLVVLDEWLRAHEAPVAASELGALAMIGVIADSSGTGCCPRVLRAVQDSVGVLPRGSAIRCCALCRRWPVRRNRKARPGLCRQRDTF